MKKSISAQPKTIDVIEEKRLRSIHRHRVVNIVFTALSTLSTIAAAVFFALVVDAYLVAQSAADMSADVAVGAAIGLAIIMALQLACSVASCVLSTVSIGISLRYFKERNWEAVSHLVSNVLFLIVAIVFMAVSSNLV